MRMELITIYWNYRFSSMNKLQKKVCKAKVY